MIPHHQTHFYAGTEDGITRGNCFQVAIASILDLEVEQVPHFVDIDEQGGPNWWHYFTAWCHHRGLDTYGPGRHIYTGEYYLVSGKSPRGDWHHVVVYRCGKMVHDPHPDGTGIETEEYFTVIRPQYLRT